MALVCRDLDLDPKRFPPKSFSAKISNLKNELIDEEDFAAQATDASRRPSPRRTPCTSPVSARRTPSTSTT